METSITDDDQYAISFSSSLFSSDKNSHIEGLHEALDFFETNGYIVIRDVFNSDQCIASRAAMWNILESSNPQFNHQDIKTWSSMKSSGKYGLSTRGPVFHPVLVDNRQNPLLAQALAVLLGNVKTNNIMVSHDRFTVYRATCLNDSEIDSDQFSTGPSNLHLDMNPWWWLEGSADIIVGAEALKYVDPQEFIKENNLVVNTMGRHLQCVLNFEDNLKEDGGTLIVPGFHRELSEWCALYSTLLRKPLPWVTLPIHIEQQLISRAIRVPMREGSVLIWDQRVMHGTAPNRSSRCRMAQYMKAFLRDTAFSAVFNTNMPEKKLPVVKSTNGSKTSGTKKENVRKGKNNDQAAESSRSVSTKTLASVETDVVVVISSLHSTCSDSGSQNVVTSTDAATVCPPSDTSNAVFSTPINMKMASDADVGATSMSTVTCTDATVGDDILGAAAPPPTPSNNDSTASTCTATLDISSNVAPLLSAGSPAVNPRLRLRANALKEQLIASGAIDIVTPLGYALFGLQYADYY